MVIWVLQAEYIQGLWWKPPIIFVCPWGHGSSLDVQLGPGLQELQTPEPGPEDFCLRLVDRQEVQTLTLGRFSRCEVPDPTWRLSVLSLPRGSNIFLRAWPEAFFLRKVPLWSQASFQPWSGCWQGTGGRCVTGTLLA